MGRILFRIRTGAAWRDLPERHGSWNTVYVSVDKTYSSRTPARSRPFMTRGPTPLRSGSGSGNDPPART
ncbi:transposase [Streptomyces althioticus]|uniref:transposase n=1 Tax=Streptomyces althioticus TaxID=83380 RepID=UPI0033E3F53E